jgi:phosphate butyryltransferase
MLTTFDDIIKEAQKRGGRKVAIAGADGEAVLEAVNLARTRGIMNPIFVGNQEKIHQTADSLGISIHGIQIIHREDDIEICDEAVSLVDTGKANALMKGKVSTPAILRSVLNKKFNLRTDRLLSHIALLEIKGYPKLLLITDGGMVIRPTLEQKVGILRNSVEMMQKLGVVRPKVAVLAAIEKVNSDMPETQDAEQLACMAKAGELGDAIVEGPLAVDVAFSPEAAEIKGVKSTISGEPDICLVPDIASGNIFAKGLWHLAKAKIGGLILGAKEPIILLSRSDNVETKMNSIALGVVTS